MSSREELLIMQQIKLMEEMQRKAREKEKRREEKKIRKQKVCVGGFVHGEGHFLEPPICWDLTCPGSLAFIVLLTSQTLDTPSSLKPRHIFPDIEARPPQAKPAWITSMVDEMSPCIEFRPSEEEFNGDPLREETLLASHPWEYAGNAMSCQRPVRKEAWICLLLSPPW
jgi:hypothetical protein